MKPLIAVTMALLSSAAFAVDIHKCKDPKGKVYYTDTDCPSNAVTINPQVKSTVSVIEGSGDAYKRKIPNNPVPQPPREIDQTDPDGSTPDGNENTSAPRPNINTKKNYQNPQLPQLPQSTPTPKMPQLPVPIKH